MSQSRREFLKSMVATSSLLSFTPAIPAFLQHAAWAAETEQGTGEKVLVVLQLSGGNDGLNTVVPFADDVYGRSRKTLRLTKQDVLPIDAYQGFHPQMKGFHSLLGDGHLAVLQSVGYPKNNRGHDEAMREWHTARPGEQNCQTGWIGRAVDQQSDPDAGDVPAAFVGPIAQPFALRAEASVVPSIRQPDNLSNSGATNAKFVARQTSAAENPLLECCRRSTAAAQQMGQRVDRVLAQTGGAEYPGFTLAGQLQSVSQLIQADIGIRIYFVELGGGGIGGFDNHANQRDNHAALLRELSESIAAFVADLQRQKRLAQVLLMTFSEFGRSVTENGRRGTGHGSAAPLFMAGGGIKGGVVGPHPDLSDLDQDALKFRIDFRRVYATVLQSWLGFDAQAVLGSQFQPVDVLA